MTQLHYSITIKAPVKKVWHTMLDDPTYREWTSAFHPGSYYIGDWETGSEIKFVSEADNSQTGIQGVIADNIPYKYVSIRYIGAIVSGQLDTTSEDADTWIGAYENYSFTEQDGSTTVDVEISKDNANNEFEQMFDEMWPGALEKLKQIAERQ